MDKALFLDVAASIGRELCSEAIWFRKCCNWLAVQIDRKNGERRFASLGPDIYEGISGICYFLSRLYQLTGDKLFKTTALGGFETIYDLHNQFSIDIEDSFFLGYPGVGFAALESAPLLDGTLDPSWTLAQLHKKNAYPRLDIIDGVAGTIPFYLYLYQKFSQGQYLSAAIQKGELLLEMAHESSRGISWPTVATKFAKEHLTGFAHGASGCAFALMKLWEFTLDSKYLPFIEGAFRYEDSFFHEKEFNWQDLRYRNEPTETSPYFSTAWCHGAPGIALTRAKAFQLFSRPHFLKQSLLGCQRTVGSLIENLNMSLCHGRCGNAEVLLLCSYLLQDESLCTPVFNFAAKALDTYYLPQRDWPSGLKTQEKTPGYMLGLAGIGDFFLRLNSPIDKLTPSVLFLD